MIKLLILARRLTWTGGNPGIGLVNDARSRTNSIFSKTNIQAVIAERGPKRKRRGNAHEMPRVCSLNVIKEVKGGKTASVGQAWAKRDTAKVSTDIANYNTLPRASPGIRTPGAPTKVHSTAFQHPHHPVVIAILKPPPRYLTTCSILGGLMDAMVPEYHWEGGHLCIHR